MKAKIPESWNTMTEYSFRFHSYDNIHNEDKHKEQWWIGNKHGIAWTCCENDVNIDMKESIKFAKRHHMSIDKMLSDIISHEIIHSILTRDVNDNASSQFDNICSRKNHNFKQWFGGMA